jgi:hypothetical protein
MMTITTANAQGINHNGNGSIHHNNINSGNTTTINRGGDGGSANSRSIARSKSTSKAAVNNSGNSRSNSNAKQGQIQGQQQGHNINDESYTDNSYTDNTDYEDKYVGSPGLAGVIGGECFVNGAEASVGWVGFAIGGGKVFLDPECDKRKAIAIILESMSYGYFSDAQDKDLTNITFDLLKDLNAVKNVGEAPEIVARPTDRNAFKGGKPYGQ